GTTRDGVKCPRGVAERGNATRVENRLTFSVRSMNRPASSAASPRFLSRGWRNTLLTAHIIFSVSLLGDSAGFLAVSLRASTLSGVEAMRESVNILEMFSHVFGIPLSFAALLTGIALGLGTKWG